MIQVIPATPPVVPSSGSHASFPQLITITAAATPWMAPGTFRNWKLKLGTAPGSGKSWTFTVWKASGEGSAASTSFAITISGTDTEGDVGGLTLSVAPNDNLHVRVTAGGTPSAMGSLNSVVEFSGSNANESGYSTSSIAPNTGAVSYTSPFTEAQNASATAWSTAGPATMTMPISGTITGLAMKYLNTDFGTGRGYTIALYKNGVKQDGTGGTVDTTLSLLSGGSPSFAGSTTFSLVLAQGDTIYAEITPVGSPIGNTLALAVAFQADTDGEFIWAAASTHGPSQAATSYNRLHGGERDFPNWDGTEGITQQSITTSSLLQIDRLYLQVGTAPGSGNAWAFDGRVNGASPASTLAITIADLATSGSDLTHAISTSGPTDVVGLRAVFTGSPSNTSVLYSMRVTASVPIRCTTIFGENGDVTSTHTFLANLDAVQRTVNAERSLAVGGNLMLVEQAAAPAGIANAARIYTEDNGAGKTRLMVQFGTGAAVQIAIEP